MSLEAKLLANGTGIPYPIAVLAIKRDPKKVNSGMVCLTDITLIPGWDGGGVVFASRPFRSIRLDVGDEIFVNGRGVTYQIIGR